jgi:hypothetical protein
MMFKSVYRLGEYQIAEDEHGLLRWETHFNFGVQRSGKCYIFGNVLILGNWSHEESGYLQLEFSELLQKLPIWDKTHYYCFISELLDVSTGQSITNDFLENYKTLTRSTISKILMNMSPGIFRLGRYQITVADNAEVLWQTYESLNRVVSGRCVIETDLLLIGPQEYDEGNQSKREFLNNLNQLPKWDKTMTWCRSSVLRTCSVEAQQTENPGPARLHQYIMDEYSFDEKPSPLYFDQSHFNQYKEPSKRLLPFNFKWLETVRRWIYGGRRWLKYLIPLLLVGLLLGLLMIGYSVEKKSLFHHGGKQHHREHDD